MEFQSRIANILKAGKKQSWFYWDCLLTLQVYNVTVLPVSPSTDFRRTLKSRDSHYTKASVLVIYSQWKKPIQTSGI